MNVRQSVQAALGLLQRRDRRLLCLAVGLQMATSLLDLAGVLLIGLVGVLAVTSVQGGALPSGAQAVVDFLGLGGLSAQTLTGMAGAAAVVLLVAKSAASLLIARRVLRFLASRSAAVSSRLCAAFLELPLVRVNSRPSQAVAYALGSGVTSAIEGTLAGALILATESALLAILGATLLVVSPALTIIAIAYFGLIALSIQRLLGRKARALGHALARLDVSGRTTIQEAVVSYREITVLDRRSYYWRRFYDLRRSSATAAADLQFIGQVPKYLLESALVIGTASLAAGVLLTRNAVEAIGTLALFLAAGARVMPSLLRLQAGGMSIHAASGGAALTYDLAADLEFPQLAARGERDGAPESVAPVAPGAVPPADFIPTVELVDVAVTYPGASNPALKGVSLAVPPGSSLAIVGRTGSGKSTLADVILGLVTPDNGTVVVGGVPPRSAVARWPGSIAYVPQNVSISDSTVRENVALGLPLDLIDDDRVWDALERAHVAGFLRDSREGLDTPLGEGGAHVSGGQRQRLGIARALYSNPRLLVLDEATSALDSATEVAVSSTLQSIVGHVTTVTIAHRLATVRSADLVAYMEDGRLAAAGSFLDVRAAIPEFDRQARLLGI